MKTKQLLIAALLAAGMTAQAQTENEPLDLSKLTANTTLTYKAGGWTYKPDGGTATPFSGTIKGDGTQVTLGSDIRIKKASSTADTEATLTFDNVNLKPSALIEVYTDATDGKVAINLKDVQIESNSPV